MWIGEKRSPAFWLTLAVFAALWGVVMYRIGPPFWSNYPDYGFGYAVPFLCMYLLWERAKAWTVEDRGQQQPCAALTYDLRPLTSIVIAVLSLSLLATFLIQEANLIWISMSWVITLQALGITLCLLFLAGGWSCVRQFWFPFFFFLTAIHWGPVEAPLINVFTRLNAAVSVESLALIGIPAVQHGNVLEISTGMVGIDEACSGIRSFHAVLMIALFFGELYRFTVLRRLGLLAIGVILAFACNVLRTLTLTVICARQGMEAMERWHDLTGVSILVGCFSGLWGVSLAMARGQRSDVSAQTSAVRAQASVLQPLPSGVAVTFLVWLVMVEVVVEGWYRVHETTRRTGVEWSAQVPPDKLHRRDLPISQGVRDNLKFDEGASVAWEEPDGNAWQAYYFLWHPSTSRAERAWVQRAMGHHPERCLASTGLKLKADLGTRLVRVNGLALPFRAFAFQDGERFVHIFHCVWHDGTSSDLDGDKRETATTVPRLTGVLTGNRCRGRGLRTLELAVWGIRDEESAGKALQRTVEGIVR